MCVVSNIVDQGVRDINDWKKTFRPDLDSFTKEFLTQTEISDLKRRVTALEEMLKAAKIYDEVTGQPDCESEQKKQQLQELADELGIEIEFPE